MTFALIEIVGTLAFLSNVAGNVLLARKRISGWIVRIGSIILWGAYALGTASPSLTANAVVFFFINCYGFWNWRKSRDTRVVETRFRDVDRDGPA